MPEKKYLEDYFDYEILPSDDLFTVLVNGKKYNYTMTLSPNVPDCECCHVVIDGEDYYFG